MTKKSSKQLLTAAQIRERFEARGISIARWAIKHNINPNTVSDLLTGRKKGIRGEAHKAAVLLGLKHGEVLDDNRIEEAMTA